MSAAQRIKLYLEATLKDQEAGTFTAICSLNGGPMLMMTDLAQLLLERERMLDLMTAVVVADDRTRASLTEQGFGRILGAKPVPAPLTEQMRYLVEKARR